MSDTERAELWNWIDMHPDNQILFNQLSGVWDKTNEEVEDDFEADVDLAWNKVQKRIRQGQTETEGGKKTKVIAMFPSSFLKIAASITIFFITGVAAYFYLQNQNPVIQVASNDRRTLFTLPDESKVWLQPHSTLSYTQHFEGNTREVQLSGEGFFEVKRNEEKPFVVLGQKTKVYVLGTSFVVHSKPNDKREYVVVATGKVQFSEMDNKKNYAILTAGDEAFFVPAHTIEHKVNSSHNASAWKSDRLQFNNTSLKEVIADLQLYFEVEINVENQALLNCRFTGDFESPTLKGVLDVLTVSLNSTYQKQNATYTLYGIGCP